MEGTTRGCSLGMPNMQHKKGGKGRKSRVVAYHSRVCQPNCSHK